MPHDQFSLSIRRNDEERGHVIVSSFFAYRVSPNLRSCFPHIAVRGAMIHLQIFPAIISLRSSFCEITAFIVDCCFNHRDHNQQKCDKCHLTYYWELSDRSYHKPCCFGKTCSKQGAYKWKNLFR